MSIKKLQTFRTVPTAGQQACIYDINCMAGALDSTCEVQDAACWGIGVVDGPCAGGAIDQPCGWLYVSDHCNPLTGVDAVGCKGAFITDTGLVPGEE